MEEAIKSAMAARRVIQFTYHGLSRIAEPHVLGILKGKTQLLVYQIGGQSKSGGIPEWRRVDLDGISDLEVLDDTFPGPRQYPSGKHSSFDQIIAVVK